MSSLDRLTSRDNLYWAWGKVRRYYRTMDAWSDEVSIAEFESNLEAELANIRRQFVAGRYRISPLRPLPQPKKADSRERPQVRQAFWVTVADQVAWIAVVNVIGPSLEAKMPMWSYGNRLYRPAWIEEIEGKSALRLGQKLERRKSARGPEARVRIGAEGVRMFPATRRSGRFFASTMRAEARCVG
jgi:hypothetical protein